jgi:signal peptidase II
VRVTVDAVREATQRRREVRSRWTRMAVIAAIAFVLDQVVKAIVRSTLAPGERREVFAGLEFSRVTNEGIAFGLFPGRQGIVAVITVVALTAIAAALAGLVRRNPVAATGAGLLGGGSIGNLVDRLVHGGVTDYIHFSPPPLNLADTFNLADMCIVAGAGLIVLGLLQQGESGEPDV